MMETAGSEERVLCIPRASLPPSWLEDYAAITMSEDGFYDRLGDVSTIWMPRRTVENNQAYKQLIPYVVIRSFDGSHVACYLRKGTEARLHALWSIGIGGHINSEDCPAAGTLLPRIVGNGLERELREEFDSTPLIMSPIFNGIINEELTPVGNVHLGLVFTILVEDRDHFIPGAELNAFAWLAEEEILSRPLELWSRLTLNLLQDIYG